MEMHDQGDQSGQQRPERIPVSQKRVRFGPKESLVLRLRINEAGY
jgi:hypothetical protein